jgi:DNA-binding NtrC family response regulator
LGLCRGARVMAQLHGRTSRHSGTSPGHQLPLAGKSVLVIEDEALIALNVESCLLEAGTAFVKIVNSVGWAQSSLYGIPFDVAVVDLCVVDGNASPLIPVLSEGGIPVVITTGSNVDPGHPALSKAAVVLQKPHANSDLIEAIVKCVIVAPNDKARAQT